MSIRRQPGIEVVGRAAELVALTAAFASVTRGRPHILCLYGEPGIGKTRLVREFARQAPPHQLLWVGADQSESRLAYGVVDQYLSALSGLAERNPVGRSASADDPGSIREPATVGAELLDALAAVGRPVILVIDNFHFIDQESADTLLYTLRRVAPLPVLTILTTRPYRGGGEPDSSWWRLLLDPETATLMHVSGLAAEDLRRLAGALGQKLTAADASTLTEHTGGNPLHFRSLLEEVGAPALLRARRPSIVPLPVPRALAGLAGARLDALSPLARDLLTAGSVLGDSFSSALAARIAGMPDAAAALDEVVTSDLVEMDGDQVRFAEHILRAAVYHDAPFAARCALHLAAARAYRDSTALLHRVAAATGYDAALAADLAAHAMELWLRGEYQAAGEMLHSASEVASELAVREELLLRAVTLMVLAGEASRAIGLRPAVAACGPSNARTFALGLIAFADGQADKAKFLLRRVVSAADGPPVQRAWGAVALAFVEIQRGAWHQALAAADEALATEATGMFWHRSAALTAAVLALARMGRSSEAVARARALPEAGAEIPGDVDRVAALGAALLWNGDLAGAAAELERAVARADAGEPARLTEFSLTNLAEVYYLRGDWRSASAAADRAAASASDTPRFDALLRAHLLGAQIAACQGRFDDAERHIKATRANRRAAHSYFGVRLLAMARATVSLARGDADGMLAALAEPFEGTLDSEAVVDGLPSWQVLAVEALVRAADLEVALDAVARLAKSADDPAFVPWLDDMARLRGSAAERAGDRRSAETAYRDRLASGGGGGLGRGRLHLAYGRLLGANRRRREAVARLRAAWEIFTALDAAPFRAQCEPELARCGLPLGDDSHTNPFALTAAENRVAMLVAQGLTNREVSEHLFLSAKTVEYHLSHIFAKLGVTSRAQLARVRLSE